MTLTLNEFKKKNCLAFIEKLSVLEDQLETKDFTSSLDSVHHSFLSLCNSFEIKNKNKCINYKEAGSFGTTVVTVEPFRLIAFNSVVLDIDEKYSEISNLFVGKSVDEATEIANLFYDYESRCCDFCGLYFYKPRYLTPICRKEMEDFVLAYHPNCYRE